MRVSAELQKFFFKKAQRSGQVQSKLDVLEGQIDPQFSKSFGEYRMRILSIIDAEDTMQEPVLDELDTLTAELHTLNRVHRVKKASVILDEVA